MWLVNHCDDFRPYKFDDFFDSYRYLLRKIFEYEKITPNNFEGFIDFILLNIFDLKNKNRGISSYEIIKWLCREFYDVQELNKMQKILLKKISKIIKDCRDVYYQGCNQKPISYSYEHISIISIDDDFNDNFNFIERKHFFEESFKEIDKINPSKEYEKFKEEEIVDIDDDKQTVLINNFIDDDLENFNSIDDFIEA